MNKLKEEKLVIHLKGRIDSQTAANTETYILGEIEKTPSEKIILDFSEVPYISSAGLRVMLKVAKNHLGTSIINVIPDVYDVFDMTGFTKILDVQRALREISVEGCEVLGMGVHGTVYRLDGDTIIKVYGENEPLEEIQREINYARSAFIYGIPTAIAFDVVRCQNSYGAVFELIHADTLAHRMTAEPENFEKYKQKYLELIDVLHTKEVDTSKFESIKDLYNKWVDDCEGVYTEEERDVLHRIINSIPDRKILVHGDIHPKNVMLQDDELVLIDMADITYGHPIFEFAGMGLTHWFIATKFPEKAIPIVGLEPEKLHNLWKAILTHTFKDLPTEKQEKKRKLIEQFTMLRLTVTTVSNKNMPQEMVQEVVQLARKAFFPIAESLVDVLKGW